MLAPEYNTAPGIWRMAGEFNTLESAEAAVAQLRSNGQEACVTFVGGLSVIARYPSAAPHIVRCQPSKHVPRHNWAHDEAPLHFVDGLPEKPELTEPTEANPVAPSDSWP